MYYYIVVYLFYGNQDKYLGITQLVALHAILRKSDCQRQSHNVWDTVPLMSHADSAIS